MNNINNFTYNEKRILKYILEQDGMHFMRYFFKNVEGSKFILNWHHYVIEWALQKVIDCDINRLIINVPPGYTKTCQAVIHFIARGLAINPRARFMHASYSDDLALLNSNKVKDLVKSPEYNELWGVKIRSDSDSKKSWYNLEGGGMRATATGGQVTGFRAGRMEKGFTGAFIIDDPLKPADSLSEVKRNAININFNNTILSRLALESVPIIIIMQRLHDNDLTGYLLNGGSAEPWHHLRIPAINEEFEPNKSKFAIELNNNEILKEIRRER